MEPPKAANIPSNRCATSSNPAVKRKKLRLREWQHHGSVPSLAVLSCSQQRDTSSARGSGTPVNGSRCMSQNTEWQCQEMIKCHLSCKHELHHTCGLIILICFGATRARTPGRVEIMVWLLLGQNMVGKNREAENCFRVPGAIHSSDTCTHQRFGCTSHATEAPA